MKEFLDLLDALRARPAGARWSLATVTAVEGHAYRPPGARALLGEEGALRGSVSGGCLEGDLAARAREAWAEGRPRLVRYDLRSELDLVWGSGMGCEGVVEVLVEPLPDVPAWMEELEARLRARRPGSLATCLEPEGLGRRAWTDLGAVPGWFVEAVRPPVALWVFGGGEDARPLVRMARELGWTVGVADHRPAFARPERFPEAHRVVAGHPAELVPTLPLDARSAAVLMTHHYAKDLEALAHLLPGPAGYVGLMGHAGRGRRMRAELEAGGLSLGPDRLARFRCPVGLPLGGRSPEAVALAVLAEVQAVMEGPVRGAPDMPPALVASLPEDL